MKSNLRQILCWGISVLLLSACHQLHVSTQFQTDGSGELRTEVGFTAEERQNLEAQAENPDPENFCNQDQSSPEAVVTEEQRGDETWCVTTQSFENLDELRRLYEARRGLRINRLEVSNGTLFYDIDVDMSSETSDFSAIAVITWTVTLPNTPAYHNAGQAEGNTLTWTLTPDSGLINLRAESAAEGPRALLPWLMGSVILAGLCGAALLGGGVLFLVMRRRPPPTSNGRQPAK
jgi:hypothetical protein